MTGLIPIAYTPVASGVQYIGLYIPMDGRRIIARKTTTDPQTTFEYSAAYSTLADFQAAWASLSTVSFNPKVDVEANLAPLFTSFGGQPTIVQAAPASTTTPQHVIVDSAGAALDVSVKSLPAVAFAAPQHVIVDTLPATTGGATSDNQAQEITQLKAVVAALSAALPLPTGAATEVTLGKTLADLDAIKGSAAASSTAQGQADQLAQLKLIAGAQGRPTPTRYPFFSVAASQSLTNIKAGATSLYEVHVFNAASSTRVVSFYNKATAPAAGDVPALSILLLAGASFRYSLDGAAALFPLGLSFSIGTALGALGNLTGTALTALGANDVFFVAHYI